MYMSSQTLLFSGSIAIAIAVEAGFGLNLDTVTAAREQRHLLIPPRSTGGTLNSFVYE
jgi:hypothetical protein